MRKDEAPPPQTSASGDHRAYIPKRMTGLVIQVWLDNQDHAVRHRQELLRMNLSMMSQSRC
ncbi:hypothetical protein X739_04160 [Mesorhizobium sp. LNHC220B00]|nr:hypothetical protein X739_04160 [Mesorhizobium sp. LNHC220B00]ESZ00094.1 hypothetical protein X738_11640 [Mesorhizobium sp. LNHC209A00]